MQTETLGPVYTERQRQRCDNPSDTGLIECRLGLQPYVG